jgi:aldose 1-epimerase
MPDGTDIARVSLVNGPLTAHVLTYGALLQDLRIQGHAPALVLGFDKFDPYLTHSPYFGATAGRCANRIRDGHLPLAGEQYQLDRNFIGKHHLHGGGAGVGKRVWTIETATTDKATLSIRLADGEMGYPGNMTATVTYQLLHEGVLDITFSATTDKTTLCNLAHHSYFNLDGSATIANHLLRIDAEAFTPVDDELIPTGEVRSVAGHAFDFRNPKPIGPVSTGQIFDHNFCLSNQREALRPVARLESPASGIAMEIRATEPGLQVYDGARIDIPMPGLDGRRMGAHAGIALEPQVWPDAVHHSNFPQAVLHPGETYRQHTQYAFYKEPK